jgi:hypothetical protein
VTPGELGLDRLLAWEQPVHGGVEFVLVGVLDAKFLGEGGGVPVAGGGQLGAGEEEPLGDQGQHEIALPRGLGSDGGVKSQASDHGEDGLDVALGSGANVAEDLLGGDEGLSLEGATDQVDDRQGEVGEVSQRLVLDLAVLAVGAAEIVAGVGHPFDGVGDFAHVNGSRFAHHTRNIRVPSDIVKGIAKRFWLQKPA